MLLWMLCAQYNTVPGSDEEMEWGVASDASAASDVGAWRAGPLSESMQQPPLDPDPFQQQGLRRKRCANSIFVDAGASEYSTGLSEGEGAAIDNGHRADGPSPGAHEGLTALLNPAAISVTPDKLASEAQRGVCALGL